jgi:SepF-like predicted cell division protein (DUF552 family)
MVKNFLAGIFSRVEEETSGEQQPQVTSLDEIIALANTPDEPEIPETELISIVIIDINNENDILKIQEELNTGNIVIANCSKWDPKVFNQIVNVIREKMNPGVLAEIGNSKRLLIAPSNVKIIKR